MEKNKDGQKIRFIKSFAEIDLPTLLKGQPLPTGIRKLGDRFFIDQGTTIDVNLHEAKRFFRAGVAVPAGTMYGSRMTNLKRTIIRNLAYG